jgi:hypothetical protein
MDFYKESITPFGFSQIENDSRFRDPPLFLKKGEMTEHGKSYGTFSLSHSP